MRPIEIDPDIARAQTLPAWFYRDADVLDWTRRHLMPRCWHLLAPLEAVRTPRQVHPVTLLPGCVDEPLLLARDDDDRLHCLSNVCTHRGSLVATEPCRTGTLRCPYHGRRFGLDGRFQGMPEFEQTADFPTAADDLARVPFETWGPFVFASLEPAFPFAELMAPVIERVGWLPVHELVHDPGRSRDYLVRANWALYCDNYLEGFHIPFVHAGLNEIVDYGTYRTELHEWGNVQIGIARGGEAAFDLPAGSPDSGQAVAAYWFWLFPNLMLNFYPWGLSVNVVQPLAPDRTKVSFSTWIRDETRLDEGAGAALDRVEREDEAIVEAVQRGVGSRLYHRGRYSPTREQGVHHFHRLLAAMAGESA